MKKLILLMICLAMIIAGCKTRKVDKEKTFKKETVDSAWTKTEDGSSVDTSKKQVQTQSKTSEASDIDVDITPDTGAVQHLHVDSNGNIDYSGKAKDIKVHGKKTHKQHVNTVAKENKGKSQQSSKSDNGTMHKKIDTGSSKKNTTSSVDVMKTVELIACLLLLAGAIFLGLKFYFRNATGTGLIANLFKSK